MRIIDGNFEQLGRYINQLSNDVDYVIVLISGQARAGKTTTGAEIGKILNDFYGEETIITSFAKLLKKSIKDIYGITKDLNIRTIENVFRFIGRNEYYGSAINRFNGNTKNLINRPALDKFLKRYVEPYLGWKYSNNSEIIRRYESIKTEMEILPSIITHSILPQLKDKKSFLDKVFYIDNEKTYKKFINRLGEYIEFENLFNPIVYKTRQGIKVLYKGDLDEIIKVVKLYVRKFMQYFGTEICRDRAGQDFWVYHLFNSTIKPIIENSFPTKFIIISDWRFKNELIDLQNIIDTFFNNEKIKIRIIKVKVERKITNSQNTTFINSHISENDLKDFNDYDILFLNNYNNN